MSDENRKPTRQYVELFDAHNSGESASVVDKSLRSQLLHLKITSSEIDRRMNPIVALLFTQLKMMIQSTNELNERTSTRSTEKNVASE